ncbi:LacI family DNA-binding transcriptional regulator [Poriferisphaera sp. WC338]|uniref:LacI family DNA-binding transcriptional regulator n=1 Tax=Poriferisphaera sp. WC338 TaxID=3425129 RepID=UPI003D81A661
MNYRTKSKKRVTLEEVAKTAGLARTTVSDIVNRGTGENYSEDTRKRAMEAAEKLGYAPVRAAQSLASGSSRLIGLMLTRDFRNSYWSWLTYYIEQELRRLHFRLQLAVTENDPEIEREQFMHLAADRIDGLIIAPAFSIHSNIQKLPASISHVPIVAIGMQAQKTDSIVLDEYDAGSNTVKYFLKNNHKRIGYLGAPPLKDRDAKESRIAGFIDELTKHKLYLDEWTFLGPKHDDYESQQQVTDAFVEKWVNAPTSKRPTAVFCHNDQLAITATASFARHNISVPNDISLIGHDDLPESAHVVPAITTLDTHLEAQAKAAVELLLERMSKPKRKARVVRIKPTLIERESVSTPSK